MVSQREQIARLKKKNQELEGKMSEVVEVLAELLSILDPIKYPQIKLPTGITRQGNRYRATYTHNGKTVYVGLFGSVEAAVKAREDELTKQEPVLQ